MVHEEKPISASISAHISWQQTLFRAVVLFTSAVLFCIQWHLSCSFFFFFLRLQFVWVVSYTVLCICRTICLPGIFRIPERHDHSYRGFNTRTSPGQHTQRTLTVCWTWRLWAQSVLWAQSALGAQWHVGVFLCISVSLCGRCRMYSSVTVCLLLYLSVCRVSGVFWFFLVYLCFKVTVTFDCFDVLCCFSSDMS